jgi:hypothetical protein
VGTQDGPADVESNGVEAGAGILELIRADRREESRRAHSEGLHTASLARGTLQERFTGLFRT